MFKIHFLFISLCIILFTKSSLGTRCYSCGYLIDANGKYGPIIEGQWAVDFCNETDRSNWPTVTVEGVIQ